MSVSASASPSAPVTPVDEIKPDKVKFIGGCTTPAGIALDVALAGVMRELAKHANRKIMEIKKDNDPKKTEAAQSDIGAIVTEMRASLQAFNTAITELHTSFVAAADNTVVVSEKVRDAIEELKRANVKIILPDNITTTIPSIKLDIALPNAPAGVAIPSPLAVAASVPAVAVPTVPASPAQPTSPSSAVAKSAAPHPVAIYYGDEEFVIEGVYAYPGNRAAMNPNRIYNEDDQWIWVHLLGDWRKLIIPNVVLDSTYKYGTDFFVPQIAGQLARPGSFYSREEPHVTEKYHPFNLVSRYESFVYEELSGEEPIYGEAHHNERIMDYAGAAIAFGALLITSNRRKRARQAGDKTTGNGVTQIKSRPGKNH